MIRSLFTRLLALVAALTLVACAGGQSAPAISGKGTVQSINETSESSTGKTTAGAVGGALVGGAIGSLFGGGTGKTIATAVGATAGSVAGANVVGSHTATPVWDVAIRFEDGVTRVVRTAARPTFKPGDRVHVINGQIGAL